MGRPAARGAGSPRSHDSVPAGAARAPEAAMLAQDARQSPTAAAAPTGSGTAYARGGPRPEPGTVTRLFFDAIRTYDRPDALQVERDGRYVPISHRELEER